MNTSFTKNLSNNLLCGLPLTHEDYVVLSSTTLCTGLSVSENAYTSNEQHLNVSDTVRYSVMKDLDLIGSWTPRNVVSEIKRLYIGKKIEMMMMPDDPDPIPIGSIGLVVGVDDAGQLSVEWDIKRSLRVSFSAGDVVKILS